MDLVSSKPLIHGAGTPGATWQRWLDQETRVPGLPDGLWKPDTRLTVVAPHPDDEVLMCGGLLHRQLSQGRHCRVIGVTDGDRSHDGCNSWTPAALSRVRRQESFEGLRALLGSALAPLLQIVRLGLPDGGLAQGEDELKAHLAPLLTAHDVVVTTWRHDGHPDHEATGRACAALARRSHATLLEAPVWMWHWAAAGDTRVPWDHLRGVPLTPGEVAAKGHALRAHQTQLTPRPQTRAAPLEPVLGAEIVQRAAWPSEYFFYEAMS